MNEMIFDLANRHSASLSLCMSICLVVSSPAIVVPLFLTPAAVYANATPLNLTSRVYARLRFVRHMRIRPRTYKLRGGRLQLNAGEYLRINNTYITAIIIAADYR